MKGQTMHYAEIATATLDQLNEELAAAGWDSLHTEVREAREAVARLLHYTFGPFDLHDSETSDIVREATAEEAAESANAGPEGHIIACGRKCYVLP